MKKLFKNLGWPIYFIIFFAVQNLTNWWALSVSGIRGGNFIDLGAVLRWSDCFKTEGTLVYGPEDGKCGGYLYGSALLRVFNFLGIRENQTQFWGLFGGLVLAICLGLLANVFISTDRISKLFVVLVLSSPGIWLLVERGNIDELIFVLILLSTFLFIRGFEIPAILIIAITALFKFYTAPLLLLLVIVAKRNRLRLLALASFFLVVPLVAVDYFRIKASFPSTWFVSFGSPAIGFWVNLFGEKFGQDWIHLSAISGHILGLALLIFSIFAVNKFAYVEKQLEFPPNKSNDGGKIDAILLIFGSVYVLCYVLGMNYDYRLIFAAVSGVALIVRSSTRPYVVLIKWSLFLGLWLSSFTFGLQNTPNIETITAFVLIQFVGDIALGIFTAFLSLQLIKLVSQNFTTRTRA